MKHEKALLTTFSRYQLPFNFGLGGVPIGNEFTPVTDSEAMKTLEAVDRYRIEWRFLIFLLSYNSIRVPLTWMNKPIIRDSLLR